MKRVDRIMNFDCSGVFIDSRERNNVERPDCSLVDSVTPLRSVPGFHFGPQLWTASVFTTALLLCVALAFCQEGKKNVVTSGKYTIYEVNKNVTDFKEGDTSSPEAFYATYNKIMACKNKDVIAKLQEYNVKKMILPQREINNIVNMPDDWAEILKTAEILKVCVYDDQSAMVIAKLSGEKTRSPHDVRWLKNVDGKWLNTGNDRVDSPDVALLKFAQYADKETKEAKGDEWLNLGNEQSMNAEDMAKRVQQTLAQRAGTQSPAPRIIKMFPENGAKNVDPNISQVYLTFDIPMGGGRAWASNNADGTALDHDPDQTVFWTADRLTCVAPVKLQPNKKYVVYLNIRPFIGFASLAGVPSAGLTYSFETGPGPLDPERRKELAKDLFIQPPTKRAWAPEQATGQPDAWLMKTGGDYEQAWASLTEDGQEEWLELTYDEPREAVGVDVYETFNPGALVRVIAYSADKEVARWEGVDPTPRDAPNGKGISKIRFEKPVTTNRVVLYLDSPKFPGWNEIDAVGLVDKTETVHWATGAKASSTYADQQRSNSRVDYGL